ncbi:MAG: FAD-dependent oxidoreductase [Candidatus Omnitrophica bacterium]|jgi:thioredoxin reductase (NADPH)|nr:FAD-dependent oxidoreductase [Candidatus Omnitrophota bacterium]
MKKTIDLAIIGGGIAGVSAAIYAKRAGLNFCLFEPKAIGGQLLLMETVDNYTGISLGTKAINLATQLEDTIKELQIEVIPEEISKFEISGKQINLTTSENSFVVNAAIITTGASFKKLGASREEELTGRGVSYCAICDGFFFKNKTVAVVGGGNSAVEEALYLSNICSKVYLIHRRKELRAIEYLQKELLRKSNVEIIFDTVIEELKGADCLTGAGIKNTITGVSGTLSLNGLFVAIGVNPNTQAFKDAISLDESGFITTDEEMKTNHNFVWAAGDCRKRPLRQLVTASSEGAISAVSAYKYLKGGYISA